MKKIVLALLTLVAISGIAIVINGCGAFPPTINITVSPSPVVVGMTATLSCDASSSTGKSMTYSWSITGGSLSSTSGRSVAWTAPTVPGTYTVSCTVSDGTQMSTTTLSILVVTADAPIITTLTSTPTVVSAGGTAVLSCEATDPNGKSLTYSWTATGGVLGGTTGKQVFWTAPLTAGTYVITVTVSNDTISTSSTITLIISSAPVINTITPTPVSVAVSGTVVITCDATDPNGFPLTYTWAIESGGGALSSTTGKTVSWVAPSTTGTATIKVDVTNGIQTSTGRTSINVTTSGAPMINVLNAAPSTGSSGYISTITCSATDPGSLPFNITWSAPDGGTLSSTIGSPITWTAPTVLTTTTYRVIVTVSNGSSSSSGTLNLIVNP